MWLSVKTYIVFFGVLEVSTIASSFDPKRFIDSRSGSQFKHDKATVTSNKATQDLSSESSDSISGSSEEREIELPPTESSSEERAPLPAEKGELGIPEQFMKVRHGFYKGQVAVFVDSQSQEEEEAPPNMNNYHHFKRKTTTATSTTTTATTTPKARTSPPVPKTKSPKTTTTSTTTTRKPKTKPTKKLKKTKITTTTTQKPARAHPTPILIMKLKSPQTQRKSPAKTVHFEYPIKKTSSCLHLGAHCRRHNECCAHHCNWRMGMKCDYPMW